MSERNKNGSIVEKNQRRPRRGRRVQKRGSARKRTPNYRKKQRANGQRTNGRGRGRNNGGVRLSEETTAFAEAVTNPFSNAAIGAIIPDRWAPPSIPALDRLTMTLDPKQWTEHDNKLVIHGWVVAILPRSLAMGWKARRFNTTQALYRIIPFQLDFGEPDQDPRGDMYSLWVGVLATNDDYTNLEMLCWNAEGGGVFRPGMNVMSYSRHEILEKTVTGGRIVGSGLKLFPNAPPLTTGGSCYGGWLSIADLATLIPYGDVDTPPALKSNYNNDTTTIRGGHVKLQSNVEFKNDYLGFPATAKEQRELMKIRKHEGRRRVGVNQHITAANVQDLLKMRMVYPGIKGVTVRSSPLQSPVQEEFRIPFDHAVFESIDPISSRTNSGVGVGCNDLISGSDYVPAVVWRYNSNDGEPQTYTIRLESRVHLQCIPDADNPFMTKSVVPDPSYDSVALILENKDTYPVVTTGNSFKSFLSGVESSMDTLIRTASKIPLLRAAASFV